MSYDSWIQWSQPYHEASFIHFLPLWSGLSVILTMSLSNLKTGHKCGLDAAFLAVRRFQAAFLEFSRGLRGSTI